ncbi:MAG: tetratricopeptide repeat protein [Cytophagales bacterium]|nr:tetratricopeptide repeat protein [Cytophagales bacterium]MCA6368107.1 tetratricopeptide repeat protein [Cytophagales bacterium]MCA6370621.1 tetratricopeptide repeat protein [Cytophagales bacterium]MCA6375714.1 tetratricopeptide repeat protein [Cytophagales bacterium]MCA6384107.1 tetratricopeptide repeat protein [Cytophagales bacterium]
MKKAIVLFALLSVFCEFLFAQNAEPKILGNCSLSQLEKKPYSEWYAKNFSAYEPNIQVLAALKKTNPTKYMVKIFFGSWCGDSKRELPKMTKVLEKLSFPQKNLTLIGVDDSTEVYKQSPQRQEAGMNIFRVPTFIVFENGKEVGRIVEYPTETMERDLLKIFARKEYTANYFGYPQIIRWMKDGLLTDENISARGLAMQLKSRVSNESELNACGYVLMAQGNLREAITVLRINANLFPQSANCWDSLGEAYAKDGQKDKAIQAYEYVLELDPKSENAKAQLLKLKS